MCSVAYAAAAVISLKLLRTRRVICRRLHAPLMRARLDLSAGRTCMKIARKRSVRLPAPAAPDDPRFCDTFDRAAGRIGNARVRALLNAC